MTQLLISVTSVQEAELALENGADIVDLKDPSNGALGMLPLATIVEVVQWVNKRKPVSATVGDLPLETPQDIAQLVKQVNALVSAGVDIIKIGFFDIARINLNLLTETLKKTYHINTRVTPWSVSAEADYSHANTIKFIAVLFAENKEQGQWLAKVDLSFFSGVMLDTVLKNGATFLDYNQQNAQTSFAKEVNKQGFSFGIAGSLQLKHVALALLLAPTYIGFRGGVCMDNQRKNALDAAKILAIRKLL